MAGSPTDTVTGGSATGTQESPHPLITEFDNHIRVARNSSRNSGTSSAPQQTSAKPTAKSPEYDKLFADGKLEATIAIGFDEDNSHLQEINDVKAGLLNQGYQKLDPNTATSEQLQKAGIDPAKKDNDVTYYTKTFQYKGKEVKSVVTLITPSTPNAKAKYAAAMEHSELVMYGGHARHGSGPDFDKIDSPAGNYVIGKPYDNKVTLPKGKTDLQKAKLTDDYQLMMFSGCTTKHYVDDLRAVPNKSSKNLDIAASTTPLYWSKIGDNTLTMLDGVTNGQTVDEIKAKLEANHQDSLVQVKASWEAELHTATTPQEKAKAKAEIAAIDKELGKNNAWKFYDFEDNK